MQIIHYTEIEQIMTQEIIYTKPSDHSFPFVFNTQKRGHPTINPYAKSANFIRFARFMMSG
jgi:hypothetical protein